MKILKFSHHRANCLATSLLPLIIRQAETPTCLAHMITAYPSFVKRVAGQFSLLLLIALRCLTSARTRIQLTGNDFSGTLVLGTLWSKPITEGGDCSHELY